MLTPPWLRLPLDPFLSLTSSFYQQLASDTRIVLRIFQFAYDIWDSARM
jgi:hypothetical protein